VRQFRRLSPAEQQERRRQGLCFNCDEPCVHGHVCQRLFYLEGEDYLDDEPAANVQDGLPADRGAHAPPAANALVVSL
jgi:hypothetical protein